jgi:hypothetical protein
MTQDLKTKILTGTFTFLYCFYPVFRFETQTNYSEKVQHFYLFIFSSWVYRIADLLVTGFTAYLIQFVFWILLWTLTYLAIRTIQARRATFRKTEN